jgi:hypothetical protein
MRDELALALEKAVEPLREPRVQAPHAALEAALAVALDEQMDVVREHAELDDMHAEAPARGPKDAEDARERLCAAQARHPVDEADRDVLRVRTLRLGPAHVRHATPRPARLAPGTFAFATPRA